MYWAKSPPKVDDFSDFQTYDLSPYASRNFYLASEEGNLSIGIWQILPFEETAVPPQPSEEQFVKNLSDGKPIFIYYHGVGFHRAVPSRVNVYKLLSSCGYHVLTLDYRGFGDSSGTPKGENDVVSDAIMIFNFVKRHSPDSSVFFWAHSLGTGVSGSVYHHLQLQNAKNLPAGILLDAPFDYFLNAAWEFPISKAFRGIIAYWQILQHILNSLNIHYDTKQNLQYSKIPIAIIQSEDDRIIPPKLGQSLYTFLSTNNVDVKINNFGRNGYGHKFNYKSPYMREVLSDLVDRGTRSSQIKMNGSVPNQKIPTQ